MFYVQGWFRLWLGRVWVWDRKYARDRIKVAHAWGIYNQHLGSKKSYFPMPSYGSIMKGVLVFLLDLKTR